MNTENELLTAALHYASLGYKVLPIVPGKKTPLTAHGVKNATTDDQQIRAWWSKWPRANVAISTDGLCVIDVDRLPTGEPNPWPPDPAMKAELAAGPCCATPNGGFHYYTGQPVGADVRCSTSKIAPNVDVRANGGYVLVPPSRLFESKDAYEWKSPLPHSSN